MKKIIAVLALVFSQLAIAGTRVDLPIPNSGILSPKGGTISVDLKEYAIPGVNYKVTCHVNAQDSMMLGFSAYNFTWISINADTKGRSGYAQDTVKGGDNIVTFTGVAGGSVAGFDNSKFTIKNIDSALTATITSCFAEAMTV